MEIPAPMTPPGELDRVADALGDPTRRAVFKYVAETQEPVTAADVGVTFGIHRTVARAHLERLVESGLVEAEFRHRPEGGRPPKVYRRSQRRLDLQLPARQYELLAELLLRTLESFGDAAEVMARQAGFDFGRRWAESAAGDSPEELLAPLGEAGAEISTHMCQGRLHITNRSCLFREVAAHWPHLVCILDRGIAEGMLSRAMPPYVLYDSTRRSEHSDACVHIFGPEPGSAGGDSTHTPSPEAVCGRETQPATEDAR